MTQRLLNKVALVTGAADGIGRGVAQYFAKEGAKVGVLDIQAEKVAETAALINETGGQAVALTADVRKPEQIKAAVEKLNAEFGTIDVLVNNAAVLALGVLHETKLEDWEFAIDINVIGLYLVTKEVVPQMLAAKKGSIVNVASIAGSVGLTNLPAYSATKGAVIALTRAMSSDYAPLGIRTNAILPGAIETPMVFSLLPDPNDEAQREAIRQSSGKAHPVGRIGTPTDIGAACAFFASDESSFVCGALLPVDGGISTKGVEAV